MGVDCGSSTFIGIELSFTWSLVWELFFAMHAAAAAVALVRQKEKATYPWVFQTQIFSSI